MKKIFYLGFILLFGVLLVGCNQNTTGINTTIDTSTNITTENNIVIDERFYEIYQLILAANPDFEDYEEWLESVRGPQGEAGKPINLQVAEGFIQWQYSGDETWTNLIELTTLVGPAGLDGVNGVDGKEVTFQVANDYIQWQYIGDTVWNNLIAIATITGADGIDGIDGRDVLMQVAEGFIQWQYSGDETWTNLIDINTLTGIQGVGISSTSINEYGELIITYTDNTVVNIGTIYKVYTVNFIGLEGYLIDTQTVIYGFDAVAPTAPIIEGYTFIEWSQIFTNITANMSINAIYQINTYTVTFLTDGGVAIEPISDIEYNSTITLPIPTKDGYVFMGWYYGEDINSGQFTSQSIVKDNLTLYARWEPAIYTVIFVDRDDAVLKIVEIQSGESATAPIPPEITGYTFLGWSQPFANVTKNIITKATYSANQYSITYNIYDNYDPLNDIALEAGETIVSLSLGDSHSSALTSTGRVFTWGRNYEGQLGDGTTTNKSAPTEITSQFELLPGETITSLSLGEAHSSALTSTGRVFTWGNNGVGQLGDGTTIDKLVPTEITSQFGLLPGETVTSLSSGYFHSSAITSEGRVFTWGDNMFGQLGDGTTTNKLVPTEITSQFGLLPGETLTSLSLGIYHSSAITSEGRVFTWGYNYHGQIGDGTTIDKLAPTEITSQFGLLPGETVTSLSLGGTHSSAITSEGRVFTWGRNNYGQLGDGTTTSKNTPTEITSQFGLLPGETVTSLSLGGYHSSAITSEGRIFTWGHNMFGQLGDGTWTNKLVPTEITSQFGLLPGETVTRISLGESHSSAITSEGRVFTWGSNAYGQIGDGTTTSKNTPTEISSIFVSPYSTEISTFDYGVTLIDYFPIREGYTFDGWYIDSSLTITYTFTTMPSQNITLYAKWIIN